MASPAFTTLTPTTITRSPRSRKPPCCGPVATCKRKASSSPDAPLQKKQGPASVTRSCFCACIVPRPPNEQGRCCIHGKQGCLRLRGKFVCFPDIEEAKTLIKRFRREGYTSYDSVERYLPEWEFVCLDWRELQRTPTLSRPMQRVS